MYFFDGQILYISSSLLMLWSSLFEYILDIADGANNFTNVHLMDDVFF